MVGTKTTKTVTVQKRGTFGDDPFFKDSWQEWDQAMKNVVDRWENTGTGTTTTTTTTSQPETRSVYRQIRSSNVTSDDSQAVSCTEEDNKYKMMIDVKDFKPEDINVKIVDDTVVVEGKIEKKEGNAVSTQMFTRRFMLPPSVELNAVSSALSRDGVLTVNAPKLANQVTSGQRSIPITGGQKNGSTTFTTRTAVPDNDNGSDRRYLSHTPLHADEKTHDARGTTHTPLNTEVVEHSSRDHWTSFNEMVEKSQREMEDMMRRHSVKSGMDQPTSPPSISTTVDISTPSSALVRPPAGVSTSRDVITSGKNVTERQEQRWEDKPAPGVTRTNRVLSENTNLKGADGSVVGNKKRNEQESHAEGSNEEVLPDGTKKRTFTKNYETRKVYSFNTSDPKAL
ncbi:heat shock protein 67B1-like [Homarus americanus]|nr:heat shock protein 67B1-like [Homarus americanus]